MPTVVCLRCKRANPEEAAYCHFDGTELRSASALSRLTTAQMPHEFVFPSGRCCQTYDELVQGCQHEWEDARRLLRQGVFAQFLAAAGRMDLARAAQQAQSQPDPDIALHHFVDALPATQVQGPRLDLSPRRLILGAMHTGETRQVRLTICNRGKGLLQGKLSVNDGGDWLRLVDDEGSQCLLKTAREQHITLRVDTRNLTASQTYSATLTVITNGGVVEVPVRLDLTIHPFTRPPFQGVGSPREIAERMRTQPKQAVPLLENGEIARWFEANGWTYPVQGPVAKGIAAVQQFFEGMGLSKPPSLQLSQDEIRLLCEPPEVVQRQVLLHTTSKKWVYAQVDSNVPWLRMITSTTSGAQQAIIAFEVDSSLMDGGRLHEGTIQIVANAGQRLELPVWVEVRQPQEPFTRRLLKPFLAGLLIAVVYRLMLSIPADLFARVIAATPDASLPPGSFTTWLQSPHDSSFIQAFVVATWWLGPLASSAWLWQHSNRWIDVLWGAIAGIIAGAVSSATCACVLPFLDVFPRYLWSIPNQLLASASIARSVWLWTPLWIVVAAGAWGLAGGILGLLLRLLGQRGARFLALVGRPPAWLLGRFGWKRAATLLARS